MGRSGPPFKRTEPHQDRLRVARAAQQQAIARHLHKQPQQRPAPALRIGDDGLTRERDEYSHDLSAWD